MRFHTAHQLYGKKPEIGRAHQLDVHHVPAGVLGRALRVMLFAICVQGCVVWVRLSHHLCDAHDAGLRPGKSSIPSYTVCVAEIL